MTEAPPTNPAFELLRARLNGDPAEHLSPVGRWLGTVPIRADAPGEATWTVTIRPEMANPAGSLHGGIVCAILDDVLGAAVFTLGLPALYVSLNLHVDFLGAAHPGDVLHATSHVVRTGKTVVYLEGYLRHADGRLVAHAVTNLIATGAPNPFAGNPGAVAM